MQDRQLHLWLQQMDTNLIVQNGLIGYWNTKQGVNGSVWENIAPSTVGKYNGAITGAISQANGMYFDGVDDFVKIPALQAGDGSNKYEVEIYFQAPFTVSSGSNMPLIGKSSLNYTGFVFSILALGAGDDGLSIAGQNSMINYTIPKNTTVKLAMSVDITTQTFSIYFNDVSLVANQVMEGAKMLGFTGGDYRIGSEEAENLSPSFFKGHIKSVKIYNRHLTDAERTQNSSFGVEVGLSAPPDESPPVVSSIRTNKQKISDELGMNQSVITVQFDKDVTQYVARLNGVDHTTGELVHTGGAVLANSDAQVIIDWNELSSEGQNRINIYGQNATGWTLYTT